MFVCIPVNFESLLDIETAQENWEYLYHTLIS